jgi:hypothetical protein
MHLQQKASPGRHGSPINKVHSPAHKGSPLHHGNAHHEGIVFVFLCFSLFSGKFM